MQRNFLLTGLPRSGTTLTCHLLNKIEDCVALHEPMKPAELVGLDAPQIVNRIQDFCSTQRKQVVESGTAVSKALRGAVPSNHLSDSIEDGQRKKLFDGEVIHVTNVTSEDFYLFIKHPNAFTALLPSLSQSLPCFAIVRNPLAVLLSWRNAGLNITRGRVPVGERLDRRLAERLSRETDVLERQFYLLEYFFGRYQRYLPGRTIRYEDIIASGGRALSLLHPAASTLNEELRSRNGLGVQTDPDARTIAERLLRSDGSYWSFYSREDVEALYAD
jgi:hypothetical protein